ncbi:uncharacterized protein KGF55_004974 [Candida pseudojiufengensis]|uniref:uncharacterized protein n=1 Tax=Candida pseudojiufengensis TaxID=497109 RepID=UPI0022257DC2|nr:uncharacterized protein KGF55_004974 [Candida pseudojiufengensis]KAI5959742.1 hypothetical protein KGF55_004974 [Candida pseudojiufengensis]
MSTTQDQSRNNPGLQTSSASAISSDTTATTSSTGSQQKPKKINEFQDGRQKPVYTWTQSWKDWFKQSWSSDYDDAKIESRLLSQLSFFPESDGKRRASIINTDIGNNQYIHELYIENLEKDPNPSVCKEFVLIHGYAASLGLFIDNFDQLSSIPGCKIHAIDLLGFGLSSRPKFPQLPAKTKSDIYKVEDWFIDSLETWRLKRNIKRFVLMGHSFGGYLSCAYALKYNQQTNKGFTSNIIDKLVLISPVGVETSKFSLLDNSKTEPKISIEQEMLADQEDIVEGKPIEEAPKSRGRKVFDYMWEHNYSPFAIIRNSGPVKSKMISRWTTHRFAHVYYQNEKNFQNMHDYIYRVFNGKGSGEYAITRILSVGALAKLPLIDRCPQKFVDMNLPTLWLYGDKDWMNDEAGLEMTNEINKISREKHLKNLASFKIIKNAGHHLYLDNPPQFARAIFKFLGY